MSVNVTCYPSSTKCFYRLYFRPGRALKCFQIHYSHTRKLTGFQPRNILKLEMENKKSNHKIGEIKNQESEKRKIDRICGQSRNFLIQFPLIIKRHLLSEIRIIQKMSMRLFRHFGEHAGEK